MKERFSRWYYEYQVKKSSKTPLRIKVAEKFLERSWSGAFLRFFGFCVLALLIVLFLMKPQAQIVIDGEAGLAIQITEWHEKVNAILASIFVLITGSFVVSITKYRKPLLPQGLVSGGKKNE